MKYTLRTPNTRHKSFRILQKTETGHKTVKNDDLEIINKQNIPIESKTKLAKDLVNRLNKKPITIFNNENLEILENYFTWKYKFSKVVDKPSAKYKLLRAINSLGKVSLVTASENEIQLAVNKLTGNHQREAVKGLRSLLTYLKRDIRLQLDLEPTFLVKYLTESELLEMVRYVHNPHLKVLCKLAFYTGARLGEIFAFEEDRFRGDSSVYIPDQIKPNGKRTLPKNRKKRVTYIMPQGYNCFREWVTIKLQLTKAERHQMSSVVRSACRKAFPNKPTKEIKFHDLRHSYAINLVSKGVQITQLSQLLGNSVFVCEKYYVGFIASDETVEMVSRIMKT